MSLALHFLGPQFSQDALECSKEVCRTVLETVDSKEVRLEAWEDVATSLAKASIAKLCQVNIAELESMSIQSIAPQSGRGTWSVKSLKSHPRKEIIMGELEVLILTLQCLSNPAGNPLPSSLDVESLPVDEHPAGSVPPHGDLAEDSGRASSVVSDALTLRMALKGCP